MKIVSASVKVVDDKNHYSFLTLDEVEITIKSQTPSPIIRIPQIIEEEPKKKQDKKKNKKQ
jgi:hypothetical protein